MANNRMWLVCPKCRTRIMLGKSLTMGFYNPPESEELQEFYTQHHQECDLADESFRFYAEDDGKDWQYSGEKIIEKQYNLDE